MRKTVTERFRSLFQEPFAEARKFGIAAGQKVADIGAGEGYFTVPAAEIVGEAGLVYAVEPDAAKGSKIRKRIAQERLGNVRILASGAEKLGDIPSESIDLAFSAFSIHHFDDKQAAMTEIKRILRPGGAFYVLDWKPGSTRKHGSRVEDLQALAGGFARFEPLRPGRRTTRARFTK